MTEDSQIEQNVDPNDDAPAAEPDHVAGPDRSSEYAAIELVDTRYDSLVRNSNLATDIVTAFVSHNHVDAEKLPLILDVVFERVSRWGGGIETISELVPAVQDAPAAPLDATPATAAPAAPAAAASPPPEAQQVPAVPVQKSVTRDSLICLECGKRFKSLKRHINVDHDLSPDQYRTKWALPHDYPMTSPAYAQQRSELALRAGLGRGATSRKKAGEPEAEAEQFEQPTDGQPADGQPADEQSAEYSTSDAEFEGVA